MKSYTVTATAEMFVYADSEAQAIAVAQAKLKDVLPRVANVQREDPGILSAFLTYIGVEPPLPSDIRSARSRRV